EIAKTEEDHDQSGNDIDSGLIPRQKASDSAGERPHDCKNYREAGHKAKRAFNSFSHGSLFPSGKIGDVYRKHRQKAWRDKSYDALEKKYHILHLSLSPPDFENIPDTKSPISPTYAPVIHGLDFSGRLP